MSHKLFMTGKSCSITKTVQHRDPSGTITYLDQLLFSKLDPLLTRRYLDLGMYQIERRKIQLLIN